jgi:Protein of unknown function DUF262/Protein of unknown function (DUF1524)
MTLSELLSGGLALQIPEFQRDYSWSAQEARQLFEDISSVAAYGDGDTPAPPYFLGSIVLLDNGPPAPPLVTATADIVDGQQRLITLSILIACLRDLTTGQQRVALDGMLVQQEDREAHQVNLRDAGHQRQFAERVLQSGATRRRTSAAASEPALENIIANRNVCARELRSLSPEERSQLADYLQHRCRLLVMRTGDIDYAYQIFLTINDRGRRLTREDILRAEVIGPLSPDQKHQYDGIIQEFTRYQTEARSDRTKKGKTFFSHLAAIYGAKGKSIIAEVRRLVKERGGPVRFGAEVFVPLADAYLTVKRPMGERPARSPMLEHYLTAFRWYEAFGDDDWVPLAMLWLSRFGADDAASTEFLRAMDRFAVALRALGSGHRERERRYTLIRESLQTAAVPLDPEALFALSASEQRLVLNRIAKRCWVTDSQLCRLVLTRIDAHMSGRDLSYYEPAIAPRAYTVEHLLPQSGSPPPQWREAFPDHRRRLLLAQCLGNLLLVPPKVNEAAGAKPFEEKCRIYFAQGNNPFHATAMLADPALTGWTEAELGRRHAQMLIAVQEIWAFEGDLTRLAF